MRIMHVMDRKTIRGTDGQGRRLLVRAAQGHKSAGRYKTSARTLFD